MRCSNLILVGILVAGVSAARPASAVFPDTVETFDTFYNQVASEWTCAGSGLLGSCWDSVSGIGISGQALASAVVSHDGFWQAEITVVFPTAGLVDFDYQISSELNFDFFLFFIDEMFVFRDSGVASSFVNTRNLFSDFSMTVSAGTHKLSFVYDKDQSFSAGQDWVLIDNLRFTPFLVSPSVSTSQSGGGLAGETTVISWSSANTNSCQVTGPGFFEGGGTSGSVNVSVDATTTFTVTCFGSGGSIAEDVLVTASEAIPTFVNGPGTEGTEKQGAPVSILVDYSVSPPGDCPGCRVQMVIGLHDEPLGCAFDGNPSNPTIGNAAFSPLAPSIPGRYPIRQYYDTQPNCAAAMSGYSKAASRKIGFLTVTPSGAAWFSGIGDLAGGAVGSVVEGLSGDGNVVLGTSSSTTFNIAAALWLNGDLFELGLALPASANSAEQSIYGASTDGSVLAGFSSDGFRDVAYVWRDGELASPIGSPLSANGCLETNANCVANAVSGDGGLIVGTSQLGASNACAFVYSGLSSEMFALGDLTGTGTCDSVGTDISQDGHKVVGGAASTMTNQYEAFVYIDGQGMQGLGFLPGDVDVPHSFASGISANGNVIVGETGFESPAFRWENGSMTSLGTGGHPGSWALGANSDGSVIVGKFEPVTETNIAMIWDANNGARVLQSVLQSEYGLASELAAWNLIDARGISDDGLTIAGDAINPDGNQEGFVVKLATPVPEPGRLVSALAALITVIGLRRRRNTRPARSEWTRTLSPGARAAPVSHTRRPEREDQGLAGSSWDPAGVGVVCTALRREPDNTTNSVRNFSVLLLGRYFGKRLLDARRIDQDDLLPVFPGSAISLLNSRDLPTRCLAGVAETQL